MTLKCIIEKQCVCVCARARVCVCGRDEIGLRCVQ